MPDDPERRRRHTRRMVCFVQKMQAQTNGYFGGYIGKRQKMGMLEMRKCVDKMITLRNRVEGKTPQQQQRAVSGRMITDIEMNGTIRGAVEEYNCVRTYGATTLYLRSAFERSRPSTSARNSGCTG